jgi:Domain of Unknown Function (DUF1206)
MADKAAQLTTLTRLGFAARGLIYLVISYLILTTGRAEDPQGALEYLGRGGGRILLIVMTLGLLAYGIWRLADAAFDIERHGSDKSGSVERLGAGASGIIHLLLGWQAIKLVQGTGAASGDGAQDGAQSVLQLPGGGTMLIVAGVVLLGTGLYQLLKAAKGSYLKHLEPQIARKPWAKWSGRIGYAARGFVFLITGFFLASAGLNEQASEAGGMDAALAWLDSPWDMIVAIGLFGFGIFSLIEARYRVLHEVPVGSISQRMKAKLH